jgi:hypothetical protein
MAESAMKNLLQSLEKYNNSFTPESMHEGIKIP